MVSLVGYGLHGEWDSCVITSWCQRHCTTPGPMPGSVTTAALHYYKVTKSSRNVTTAVYRRQSWRRAIETFRTETKKRETDPRLDKTVTIIKLWEAVANPTTHPIWPSIGEEVADSTTLPHGLHDSSIGEQVADPKTPHTTTSISSINWRTSDWSQNTVGYLQWPSTWEKLLAPPHLHK